MTQTAAGTLGLRYVMKTLRLRRSIQGGYSVETSTKPTVADAPSNARVVGVYRTSWHEQRQAIARPRLLLPQSEPVREVTRDVQRGPIPLRSMGSRTPTMLVRLILFDRDTEANARIPIMRDHTTGKAN